MAGRQGPVVDFVSESLNDVLQVLRAVLGRTVSLLAWTMLEVNAGLNIAAAVSTDVATSRANFDLADAGIDQMRVQVYGSTAGGAGIAVLIFDVTNGRELCRVGLTITLGLYVGEWTKVKAVGADALLVVRVLGDNVNAQTLHTVRVQARTTRATA